MTVGFHTFDVCALLILPFDNGLHDLDVPWSSVFLFTNFNSLIWIVSSKSIQANASYGTICEKTLLKSNNLSTIYLELQIVKLKNRKAASFYQSQ